MAVDRISTWPEECSTSEGYRLLWYHRTRKAEQDRAARQRRTDQALAELAALRKRMAKPKTRFRERAHVDQAVAAIFSLRQVERWVKVRVEIKETECFRPAQRGRPSPDTKYVREVRTRFDLTVEVDAEQLERAALGDGVFPLLTNDRQMNAEAIVRAYKRQPLIEKRFSQLKTDFAVAPVYLKEISRIQGLLGVYFLALQVQTLMERQLRQAMKERRIEDLPLDAEDRPCRWPTARKVLDLFEPIQRHELNLAQGTRETLITELSPLQRKILSLLKIPAENYGQPAAT